LGTGSVIRPGEAQRMSAGTGITHSEFNHSQDDPVHFLQIWIIPSTPGLPPSYEQRAIPEDEKRGRLRLLAAPDGRDGAVTVHQAVDVSAVLLEPGQQVTQRLLPSHHAWIHVARGTAAVNGHVLHAGDGAAASAEALLEISGQSQAEVLLFDLA
jgi:redox-sensitive bicupin YhaK (pirin superfamily)